MKALLILLAGCGAAPLVAEGGAKEACLSVFDAFDAMCLRCSADCQAPSRDRCDGAISADEEKLQGDCLPWMLAHDCADIDGQTFRSHCAVVAGIDL